MSHHWVGGALSASSCEAQGDLSGKTSDVVVVFVVVVFVVVVVVGGGGVITR